MMYEFKVNQFAEEFGVHRNTIRNWINSGVLIAKEGPGRKYLMKFEDYRLLCEKFGREPYLHPENNVDGKTIATAPRSDRPPLVVSGEKSRLAQDPSWADSCLTCGTCAGLCPISGVDGLDPRKIVRMAVLGLDEQLVASDWPWKCTMCGKCEEACPVGIEFVALIRKIRGARNRSEVPGPIHRGVTMCLERGNNLGIPKDDFVFLCEDLGAELSEEDCRGFRTPIDVHGARVLVTVNSKIPYGEPEKLKWWWKIFYHAGESWTIPSEHWDGVNWGLFSGDDEAMKTVIGRIVDNMRRLNCQVLLLPECGHAYFATRLGLNKWFPEALKEFRIVTIFDLLLEYIESGRIRLDTTKHRMSISYHDSCNYGRKSLKAFGQAYFDEPRKIIRACSDNYRDMSPYGNSGYCCGAGGGTWSAPFAEERVFYGRIKARQISESGAKMVIVPCHNCRDQIFKSLNREYDLNIEVKYLWELVADSLMESGT
ncbi:MAG: 4Fe-4S dicluster domain-containing protein [Proteobacteria bacterium]|nr:4Fe-4S dicluster domain-containing protein [Pseudomonadota bacterium]